MPFGQVVIGPPGSGKTTYCWGMYQFLTGLGRPTVIINLDPANDDTRQPYPCSVDVRSIVCVESVMEDFSLGPNGALIYCLEYLASEEPFEWLCTQLRKIGLDTHYFLIDCPGQIELYTTHTSVRTLLQRLQRELHFRFTVVNLIDSVTAVSSPHTYLASVLVSLSSMIFLEFPHINVLSKVDLLDSMDLDLDLEFYTEVHNLQYLLKQGRRRRSNPSTSSTSSPPNRLERLNRALAEVIEDYDNVRFKPLNIQSKESVIGVLKLVDKANGYIFGLLENRVRQEEEEEEVDDDGNGNENEDEEQRRKRRQESGLRDWVVDEEFFRDRSDEVLRERLRGD